MQAALGLIETRGMVGAIEAADVAVKTADVRLEGFEHAGAGLVCIRFSGDVASVQAAVRVGIEAAGRVSEVVASHVIARPHGDLLELLTLNNAGSGDGEGEPGAWESMSVVQLRHMVRQLSDSRLQGRQVSRANKESLIAELRRGRSNG